VSWDHAVSVMAHALRPQGLVPERWHVDTFPSDEQLGELASHGE
jgi:hypothetical protein